MTNYDFALMLKVSHSIVSGWIKELHRPTFKNAQKIFKKTKGQVTLEDLGWTAKGKSFISEDNHGDV